MNENTNHTNIDPNARAVDRMLDAIEGDAATRMWVTNAQREAGALDEAYNAGRLDAYADLRARLDEAKELGTATAADVALTHGSLVIRALETAWAAIQLRHPDVPDVVIITGVGRERTSVKWGHHRASTWLTADAVDHDDALTEIMISGERMKTGARGVMSTLLHEAAHGINHMRGIKDTSRGNRYHNKRFVAAAAELGLTTAEEPHPVLGFSETRFNEELELEYADVLALLEDSIRIGIELPGLEIDPKTGAVIGGGESGKPEGGEDEPKKKTGPRKYVCDCDEPRIMRMAPSTFEAAPVVCGACMSPFHEATH